MRLLPAPGVRACSHGAAASWLAVYHHTEGRSDGHLCITVLAYQCVPFLRAKLKAAGMSASWATLRDLLSVQHRVTATFRRRDRHSLPVRKATVAEPHLLAIDRALGTSAVPGSPRKQIRGICDYGLVVPSTSLVRASKGFRCTFRAAC